MKMTLLFVTLTVLSIIPITFLGFWVYRDAKNRGLDAGKWTAIVVLVPNLIGLIIYFLIGRNEERVQCNNCNSRIQIKSEYCMSCGKEINKSDNSYMTQNKKSTKGFMVGFIVSLVAMVIVFIGMGYMIFTEENFDFNSGVSIGSVQYNIGNKLNVSYNMSNKKFSSTIKIKDNSPKNLFIESSHKKGDLSVKLVQGELEKIIDLSQERNNYEFDLSIFNEGKVKIQLISNGARGVKFKSYWE